MLFIEQKACDGGQNTNAHGFALSDEKETWQLVITNNTTRHIGYCMYQQVQISEDLFLSNGPFMNFASVPQQTDGADLCHGEKYGIPEPNMYVVMLIGICHSKAVSFLSNKRHRISVYNLCHFERSNSVTSQPLAAGLSSRWTGFDPGLSLTVTCLSLSTSAFPCQYHSTNDPYSSSSFFWFCFCIITYTVVRFVCYCLIL